MQAKIDQCAVLHCKLLICPNGSMFKTSRRMLEDISKRVGGRAFSGSLM